MSITLSYHRRLTDPQEPPYPNSSLPHVQERTAKEERLQQEEKELDFLAPLLAQLGDPENLTRQAAIQLT